MDMLLWILIVTAVAGVGGTGLGGMAGAMFRRDSNRVVSLLLAFAGGVMLSVVCYDLTRNAMAQIPGTKGLWAVLFGLLVGYVVVWGLNIAIDKATNHEVVHVDKTHPKTADDLGELIHADHYKVHRQTNNAYQMLIGGVVMAAAIALHNLPEGMVIGAAYAAPELHPQTFTGAGFAMALVIGLHNIPEGMAVAVPLISGGMRKDKAVFITALSGLPTVIGALLGYQLGSIGPAALTGALSFASGAMLYVVFGELFPEAFLMWRSKAPALFILVGMMVGLIMVYA